MVFLDNTGRGVGFTNSFEGWMCTGARFSDSFGRKRGKGREVTPNSAEHIIVRTWGSHRVQRSFGRWIVSRTENEESRLGVHNAGCFL